MDRKEIITIKDLKIDYRNLQHFTIQQMIKNPALKGGNVIHAVRGVDLTVEKGEIIGIIGANGAGKSTLLKAVAGIFRPDSGTIDTHGCRVSLMSLGVGFKWELSGRDNVMLAGLLLRYPASYVKERMQDIIDFSELGAAIDHPVRTYSDGMYAKLSFAITAVLETDVMLVDELLSVGDEHFRKKSFNKIKALVRDENMTGLIVSHDLELVKSMCTRVVWMNRGRIVASGDPEEITAMYARFSAGKSTEKLIINDHKDHAEDGRIAMFRGLEADDASGRLVNVISPGVKGGLDTCISWEPLKAAAGSRIRLKKPGVIFRMFTYKREIPPELIYTSTMPPEGCAMIYDPEASLLNWQDAEVLVPCDSYIRLSARSMSGSAFESDPYLDDIFEILPGKAEEDRSEDVPSFLKEELEDTASKVTECRRDGDFVFIMPADTHYAFGNTWNNTASCIKELARRICPDMIIHLGDITDGKMPESLDCMCDLRVDRDLKDTGVPVRYCVGNHDIVNKYTNDKSGYAKRKTELITEGRGGCFFEDLSVKNIRCIFLSAYDPSEADPYGFSEEDILWLDKTLKEMPEGVKALIFTHVSPLLNIVQESDRVRNAAKVREVLKAAYRDKNILGVFAGHSHKDSLDNAGFPVVRCGCAKLEDHTSGSRPLHTGKFTRLAGTVTQELFDTVIVHPDTAEMDIIRFGKGEDRHAEAE